MKKATLYKSIADQKVKCTACSHYCVISPPNTGICSIRQNIGGDLYLLVHSKGYTNTDQIEKKPLYHFLPGSRIFSIGTVGCNFGCLFCQNYFESQSPKKLRQKLLKEGKLKDLEKYIKTYGKNWPPEKVVSYCLENDIPSIAYTYNEPSVFFEYSYDTAKLAHEKGLKNVYVSNGYASPEAIDEIAPYLDAINVDLKSFDTDFYKDFCFAKLEPVLKNIKYYYKKGIWLEITTLIIPGENDSDSNLKSIAEYIASISKDIPWHISRFSPAYKMMDKDQTPIETLKKAYHIGKEAELKFVYAGNILDEKMHTTFCPKCNKALIERNWNYAKIKNIEKGKCLNCNHEIPGIWK